MQVNVWVLVVAGVLWVSVYILHAIRVKRPAQSTFELERLAAHGDHTAKDALLRMHLSPRVMTLLHIDKTLVLIAAIGVTIASLGWLLGITVATVLSLLIPAAARLSPLRTIAGALFARIDADVFRVVANWRWLDALRFSSETEAITISSKAELQHLIAENAEVMSRDELLRVQAGLDLDNQIVSDVMTPVSVLDTADVNDTLGPLVLDDLHKTGHSRFPVIDGDIHHVVGMLYLHQIINVSNQKNRTIRDAMDPRVHYIHENQTLEHALSGFLKTHHHLFVVVNDYRETVGVVTLEDVIETVIGKKIVDEFDQFEDLRAVAESNPRKNNLPKGKLDI